jgi:cell wall-associated NlpC family hydrolase
MVAGLQYVFAANSGDTGKAKTRMQNAVAGFVLMLFISIILRTVNPALIVFNDLNLRFIDEVAYISDSGDTSGSTNSSDVTSAGISCPGSGDVSTIARSFIGRVAYRFGGKGGPAPYTGDKKTCDDGPCSSYCPEGNVCLDCSGFVGKVAECAGLGSKNESSGTTGIFSSAPKVLSCTADTVTTSSGTYTLTPGDLVGFKPGDYTKTPSFGHVWMYIGNNEIINSRGKGRAAGSAVAIDKLTWACKTYPLRFVDR